MTTYTKYHFLMSYKGTSNLVVVIFYTRLFNARA